MFEDFRYITMTSACLRRLDTTCACMYIADGIHIDHTCHFLSCSSYHALLKPHYTSLHSHLLIAAKQNLITTVRSTCFNRTASTRSSAAEKPLADPSQCDMMPVANKLGDHRLPKSVL